MARSHGRILSAIWSDPDFLALPPGPQRLFMFLLSQPDLAHCGLIALRERRWARGANGLTADQVSADLETLAAGGFVVVDHDTEEVLIRSLIRRDDVWRQPNVLAAAIGQFSMVTSTRIRAALAVELRRIRAEAELVERAVELIDAVLATLPGEPTPDPSRNPSRNPSPKGSPNPSAGLIRESAGRYGEGERYVSGERVPLSPSPDLPPPAGAASPPADTAQSIVGDYVASCAKRPPGQVLGQLGKAIAGMLAEGVEAADIRCGVKIWAAKGLHPATLPSVVNEAMNGQERPLPGPTRTAPTGQSRNGRILAAARERALAAEGAA